MARDGDRCTICHDLLDRALRDFHHPRYITFDHIVPRSAGGLSDLANLRLAHQHCNHARGNDPLVEELIAS
jgi:5-methylcytosine-specific restriction endonuclease McrA